MTSTSPAVAKSRRVTNIAFLDLLRLIASLWVVIGHVCIIANKPIPWLSDGWIAVEIFIFISGFLMCYILKGQSTVNRNDFIAFWVRRFFRIAPFFFLAVFIYVFFRAFYLQQVLSTESYFHASHVFSNFIKPISILDVIKNMLFIHGIFPGEGSRIFGPAWSLSLEMQFYIVAPFLLNWYNKNPYKIIAIVALVNALAVLLLGFHGDKGWLVDYGFPSFLPCRILLFLLGMVFCKAIINHSDEEMKRLLLVIILCLLIYNYKAMVTVLLSLSVVYIVINYSHRSIDLFNRFCSMKLIQALANYSYGVYLIHQFMIAVVSSIFLPFPADYRSRITVGLYFLVVVTFSLISSGILYHIYEVPFRKWGIKLSQKQLQYRRA